MKTKHSCIISLTVEYTFKIEIFKFAEYFNNQKLYKTKVTHKNNLVAYNKESMLYFI